MSAHGGSDRVHIPALDGLRGIAILLVLMFHSLLIQEDAVPAALIHAVALSGWAGVNLFFVDEIYYDRFGILDNSPEKLYPGVDQAPAPPLSTLVKSNGEPQPPNHRDLVWKNVRIKKRFLIDQY